MHASPASELGHPLTPEASWPNDLRPKVLQLGKFYPPHMGGIETHLQALCREIANFVDVKVVVASDGHERVEHVQDQVPIVRVPTWLTFASTPLCPGMIAQIRASRADIVHIHLPNPTAVLAYLASGHRGRLVVTYHSDTVRQKLLGALFEPFVQQVLRRSAAVIATSPNYRRSSRTLAACLDRCHVIPYGIPVEQFAHCDPAAISQIRARFGERLVISVGRLVYYKGFEYLIRAMSNVNGRLLIVGDGPLRQSLEQLSQQLGLAEKVIFAGEIQNEQVVPYYHAAELFALASVARSEEFGIVQIEAMAAGLPVVNTALDSGVPFVSLHDETGFTVPPEDAQALAAAINRLLDDHALRRTFGTAAGLRAQKEFSLAMMIRRTLALYDSVLPSDRRRSVADNAGLRCG